MDRRKVEKEELSNLMVATAPLLHLSKWGLDAAAGPLPARVGREVLLKIPPPHSPMRKMGATIVDDCYQQVGGDSVDFAPGLQELMLTRLHRNGFLF